MFKNVIEDLLKRKGEAINFLAASPIADIGDGYSVMKSGDICYLYKLDLYEEERLNKDDYLDFIKKGSVLLNDLAPGDLIQQLDVFYDLPQKNEVRGKLYKGKPYANRINHKINAHFEGREVIYDKTYLCVVFSKSNTRITPTGTRFSNPQKPAKTNFNDISERLEGTVNRITGIESQLKTIYPRVDRLNEQEIYNLYFQFFNLDFTRNHDSVVKQHNNGFSAYTVGEKKLNIITLSERPDEFEVCKTDRQGVITPFIGELGRRLHCPHILSQTIRLKDTDRELKKLDRERTRIETTEQADKITSNDIASFTKEAREKGLPIVDYSLQVLLYNSNDSILQNAITSTENRIKNLNSAIPSTETNEDIGNLYFANAPGNMNDNYRWITPMLSSQALSCMNYTTTFVGDEEGDYICNRERRLIKINFSSEDDLNNQHAVIVGPSGSGKSVLMALLIGQRHARREKQIIIDSGGTYKNLITLLGGDYHEYNPNNPLKGNPFLIPIVDGKYNLTEDKILYLQDFIVTAWKGSEKAMEVELAVLRKWLIKYYGYVNADLSKPSLKKFLPWIKNYLSENKDDFETNKDLEYLDFEEFHRIMEQYTFGIYEQAINSEEIEEIGSNDLICYDLKEIKENQKLYPLVTKQIIELTKDFTLKYESIRKWLYLEEAWTSLEDKIGEMVSLLFRTWRKHKGAVYTITQGVKEILKSKVGYTMLDNSDVRFILNHKGKSKSELEELIATFGLTELDVEKLLNLRKEEDFRDALVKRLDRTDIVTVEMPPYVYAATSSRETERNLLRNMFEYYGNMEYAVNQFVEIRENKRHD